MHPPPHPLQPSSCLATPHPSCLLQTLPSLFFHPLNPSSSLLIHRFNHFNFFFLLLILFLLCSQFGLSCHSSSFLSSSISSISVFSSAEPFVFSCNTSFHPLQLSSLVSNPLPPLYPHPLNPSSSQ